MKATFVVAFVVAALCAGLADAKAAGIEDDPIGTLPSRMPACPECGSDAAVKSTIADTGEIVYMCWTCKIIFGKKN
ncbi:MAG: hypothetical protein IKT75_06205 [Alistipes sp.]|nr:hypothetical protein [Alistipes sp.]